MSEVRTTFRLKPGDAAPDFCLPDASSDGRTRSLPELMGPNGLLVAFVCNHCPFVVHLAGAMADFAADAATLGVNTVAISSNDVQLYPQDSPEKMKEFAAEHAWSFPYLHDESQEVALSYGAACTPDFLLFDGEGRLFYTGQFDSTRPNRGKPIASDQTHGEPDGRDLRDALERMVRGASPPDKVYPSSGCNIKWKEGRQPEWWASGNP